MFDPITIWDGLKEELSRRVHLTAADLRRAAKDPETRKAEISFISGQHEMLVELMTTLPEILKKWEEESDNA